MVKFKSHFYFEEKDRVTEAEKALEPLKAKTLKDHDLRSFYM